MPLLACNGRRWKGLCSAAVQPAEASLLWATLINVLYTNMPGVRQALLINVLHTNMPGVRQALSIQVYWIIRVTRMLALWL